MTLQEVVKEVRNWFMHIINSYKDTIKYEILKDTENVFTVDLETVNYAAQLVVEDKGFHPHRFVCFYALDINKDINQDAYSYYDSEESSIDEIIVNLNNAVRFISGQKNIREFTENT